MPAGLAAAFRSYKRDLHLASILEYVLASDSTTFSCQLQSRFIEILRDQEGHLAILIFGTIFLFLPLRPVSWYFDLRNAVRTEL